MPQEVALLEWNADRSAVRFIGRSTDPAVIDHVRQELANQLWSPPTTAPPLRLIQDTGSDEGDDS